MDSRPTDTQGLKIIEEMVLPLLKHLQTVSPSRILEVQSLNLLSGDYSKEPSRLSIRAG